MNDIYMLSDTMICERVGYRLKQTRLKQNITQQSLAEASGVSLSSLKKIEKGEIGSFDSLLRVIRTLGLLDVLRPLVEEEQLSPNEYYALVNAAQAKKTRKRAAKKLHQANKEESSW